MKAVLSCLFILVLSVAMLTGCAHAPAGLAPSSSPIDNANFTVLGHATGEMTYFSVFGIFPLDKPDYNRAIADAVSKFDGGKSLINVRARFETTWVVVGTLHRLVVEGDVIK